MGHINTYLMGTVLLIPNFQARPRIYLDGTVWSRTASLKFLQSSSRPDRGLGILLLFPTVSSKTRRPCHQSLRNLYNVGFEVPVAGVTGLTGLINTCMHGKNSLSGKNGRALHPIKICLLFTSRIPGMRMNLRE